MTGAVVQHDSSETLYQSGCACLDAGRLSEAIGQFEQAVAAAPGRAEVYQRLGHALGLQGRLDEAAANCRRALEITPDHVDAHCSLGYVMSRQGLPEEAIASYRRAVALQPGHAKAHYNLGSLLLRQGRPEEAVACFRAALAVRPEFAEAHYNLGAGLLSLRHTAEAAASFRRAIGLKEEYAEAHYNLGVVLLADGMRAEARWHVERAVALKPDFAPAQAALGTMQLEEGRLEEAAASLRRAVVLQPDLVEAHVGLAAVLLRVRDLNGAVQCYERAIALKPDCVEAWYGRGAAYIMARRYEQALADYAKVCSLQPDYPYAYGLWLQNKMMLCDWDGLDAAYARLFLGIEAGMKTVYPFTLLPTPATAELQKRCSEIYLNDQHAARARPDFRVAEAVGGKLRIGYFSADFFEHATAYLLAGLLERHNRARFEIIGFSFGPRTNDRMQQRVVRACDRFVEVQDKSDAEVAALARALGVQIAVDLKGVTQDSRPGIFAQYAAPVQVNYLGYPGTMAAPYMDYLIADRIVVPEDQVRYYSERIVYLPDSYQVNDGTRAISPLRMTRAEAGLPEHGFVFCCFNNNYKITPDVFDIWMRLLARVPGSVLWLFRGNEAAERNLRREAMRRGIAAERLVFADFMEVSAHLARHRLADLFLDTFNCNAHTTASDALWAGLPVLTCLGRTFAGRVAGSLVTAAGLAELVTRTPEEYEAQALELATQPDRLAALRRRLADNRTAHPLFDTERFARRIESIYLDMWDRHRADRLMSHASVA